MILSETQIDKHSCLVLDPPVIPPGAPVVVTLHGLGTNADDLVPFCEQLKLLHCRFVLPDAPLHLPGYPEGAYAWYDFQAHNRKEIEQSRDFLFRVLDRFSNDPNLRPSSGSEKKPSPLILLGFSQGGVMSLEAGLNYKGRIAAIVSMSGYMPDPWATLTKAEAPFETPILLVHGTEDQVVPVEGSRHAAESLRQTGYNAVTLKELPMGHTITMESMREVAEFLKQSFEQGR
ncbi:MAG TPA: alpha/beta fold hydrolase [bacterium]|nr:alpha/beta fold hydrolase [bacterium]